jgi:hypothetical protein
MKKTDSFRDETPHKAVVGGDLAYGRRFGKRGSGKGDFPAFNTGDEEEWEKYNNNPFNAPVIPYVMVEPRDEKLYEDMERPSASMKKVINTDNFKNDFLKLVLKKQGEESLKFNLSFLKIGKLELRT